MIERYSCRHALHPFFFSLFILLIFSGCEGKSASSSLPQIKVSSGGTITSKTESGIQATLNIPAGSLPYDTAISLDLSQSEDGIEINLNPDTLKLNSSASITIDFDRLYDTFKTHSIVDSDGTGRLRPLKQTHKDNSITGTIYMLKPLKLLNPNVDLIDTISYEERRTPSSSSWQEMNTTFNSFIWMCAYYKKNGMEDEALECMSSAVTQFKNGSLQFLEREAVKSKTYIRSLDKLNVLMELCNNPVELEDVRLLINKRYSDIED